jgi:hypothetical protein
MNLLSRMSTATPTVPTDALEQLEAILQSPSFVSSRRCQDFLRYVVREFIEGRADTIKERTIALEVFGKSARFDSATDSLVRVKAREVRKRLAEYYESSPDGPLRIELPLGAYVPVIRAIAPAPSTPVPHPPRVEISVPPPEMYGTERVPKKARISAPKLVILLTIAISVALMVVIWTTARRSNAENPVLNVWAPLLNNPNAVLISTGRPVTPSIEESEPSNLSIRDHFGRPEFRVSLTTADAIANIAGLLQQQKKQFRIHDAASNALSDFHDRSVVLVNGNDNKWTLLLLKPTRFNFVSENNGNFSYIRDSKKPSLHDWSVDFSQPFHKQTTDYAIVGRFNSSTTGGPVIVIAGISSNGTEAAGEFIVSPERLSELLRSAPPGWKDGNFEAVLKVEVVDGNTGASSVIASEFW